MQKIYLALICLIIGCTSSTDLSYIESTGWTYDSGYRISDYVTFDSTHIYELRHDTIFMNGYAKATIKYLKKRSFDLKIQSIETGEIGHYMDDKEMYE